MNGRLKGGVCSSPAVSNFNLAAFLVKQNGTNVLFLDIRVSVICTGPGSSEFAKHTSMGAPFQADESREQSGRSLGFQRLSDVGLLFVGAVRSELQRRK